MIKIINNKYTDENNNTWSTELFTKQEAIILHNNCSNCNNCSDCINCSDCSNCSNCSNCNSCSDYSSCNDCRNCRNCSSCSSCSNCSICSDCSDCISCSSCSDCSYCINCSDCSNCSYCNNCNSCSNCSDFPNNPLRYTTPKIGPKKSQTIVYWLNTNIQIIDGYFKGNLEEFIQAVKNKHANTIYLSEYLNQIRIIKYLLKNNKHDQQL